IAAILGISSTTFAILGAPAQLCSIAVIKGYAFFEKPAEHMGLIPRSSSFRAENHPKSKVIATIEEPQSKVEVTCLKYSSVLTLKATDESADFAQRLANAVALGWRLLR
ncbi:MAG: hypothetical protein ACM34H_09000, partial [Deltaproteobacteria bacterium]